MRVFTLVHLLILTDRVDRCLTFHDVARPGSQPTSSVNDITDVDGSRPDCWSLIADHGWSEEDPEIIAMYR